MRQNNNNPTFLQKTFLHLKTIHEHRSLVRKFCFQCGLYKQGLTHDLSKYSFAELLPSIHYYQGYRSPYTKEKELLGYSLGWLHHKGCNKHHWEYWYDTVIWNEKLKEYILLKREYKYEKYEGAGDEEGFGPGVGA